LPRSPTERTTTTLTRAAKPYCVFAGAVLFRWTPTNKKIKHFVGAERRTTDTMTMLNYSAVIGGHMLITCSKCKCSFGVEQFSKDKHRSTGRRSACKACSAEEFRAYRQSSAYGERLQRQLVQRRKEKIETPVTRWATVAIGNARRRAKAAGIACTITKAWLVAHAPTHCALLEVPLDYQATTSTATSASVDRRDSALGYTPDNCRIISFKANRIKSNASVFEIALLAKNLTTY